MGLNPSTLPKHTRAAAGITLASGRARPALAAPVAGHVLLLLRMDPPTCTHHDKEIVTRWGKGGVARGSRLKDSLELVAARQAYELAIPERRVLVPLKPPVLLRIVFTFAVDGALNKWEWRTDKPDNDNAAKLLTDVLSFRGYLSDDKHVAMTVIQKRDASPLIGSSVHVYLRTLVGARDDGRELAYMGAFGEVETCWWRDLVR